MRFTSSSLYRLFCVLAGAFLLVTAGRAQAQDSRIAFNDQQLFLSGGNVAWVNFARDIGPGNTNLTQFEEIFSQLQDSSGNAMRLWLHINGASTPAWDGSTVTGPGEGTIEDLRAILDRAWEHGIGLQLCLWSFDMLSPDYGEAITSRARDLLTDSTLTQRYIDNALIPMVDELQDHPAIIAWEIFNEPEGMSDEFGFIPEGSRVPMSVIQKFVNRTAGAIHRTDPDAKVTNGSAGFTALAERPPAKRRQQIFGGAISDAQIERSRRLMSARYGRAFTKEEVRAYYEKRRDAADYNYYTDERLIEAGGDPLGTLDYYNMHYYEWEPPEWSPFHHDYEHWGLEKPLVVGEFFMGRDADPGNPSSGDGDPNSVYGVDADSLYTTLYERGYAGAMGWQWFNYPESGEGVTQWPQILASTQMMGELHPEAVDVDPGLRVQYFRADPPGIEAGQSTELSWLVMGATSVALDGDAVGLDGTRTVSPTETTTYTLAATGEDSTTTLETTVEVLPPLQVNRSLGQAATASTVEACCDAVQSADLAVDGNASTRWSSAWQTADTDGGPDPNLDDDPGDEWIVVDLGQAYDLRRVVLSWEAAYGSSYDIETSYGGQRWTDARQVRDGDGGTDSLFFEEPYPSGRYVRMHGLERATEYGYSLYEFEAYGLPSEQQPPAVSFAAPHEGAVVAPGASVTLTADASDPDGSVQQVSFFADGDSLGTATDVPYTFDWTAPEGAHEIAALVTDDSGISVMTDPYPLFAMDTGGFTRFEAESADLEGDVEVAESGDASGGAYLDINGEGNSTVTFDNISVDEAGAYTMTFGYNLEYDAPKSQHLVVNGDTLTELRFNGAASTWLERGLEVPLQEGTNTVQIAKSWGWMYLDYVAVEGAQKVAADDPSDVTNVLALHASYPNPASGSATIPYVLPTAQRVQIGVYDVLGRRVDRLVDARQRAGEHEVHFEADGLPSGVYFVRLQAGASSRTGRMVVVR